MLSTCLSSAVWDVGTIECLCDWSPINQIVSHTYQFDPRRMMCALGDALRASRSLGLLWTSLLLLVSKSEPSSRTVSPHRPPVPIV